VANAASRRARSARSAVVRAWSSASLRAVGLGDHLAGTDSCQEKDSPYRLRVTRTPVWLRPAWKKLLVQVTSVLRPGLYGPHILLRHAGHHGSGVGTGGRRTGADDVRPR
jgi:hypothetical protein